MSTDENIRKIQRKVSEEHKKQISESSLAAGNASTIRTKFHQSSYNYMERFLGEYFEGYILGDLKSMAEFIPADVHPGGVGYPMVQTVCSGMELLGLLLRRKGSREYCEDDGLKYFSHYWKYYLSIKFPLYIGHSMMFRQLIRNGLAHVFLTKQGIGVGRQRRDLHMQTIGGLFRVNCIQLYEDFRDTYYDMVRPKILDTGDGLDLAMSRLTSMLVQFETDSHVFFVGPASRSESFDTPTTTSGTTTTPPAFYNHNS